MSAVGVLPQGGPVLARVRVSVPDRPGTLGLVASAVGLAGADIVGVDVLESESGRAVDDLFIDVRDAAHLDRVSDHLHGVAGVTVQGRQAPAPPATRHTDLELIAHVLASPQRALRTLVDGAPAALGADWAAIVAFRPGSADIEVVGTSARCPGPEAVQVTTGPRLASVTMSHPSGVPFGGAAVVPLGRKPLALALVREDGPQFHWSELWRLGQVGSIVATVVVLPSAVDLQADEPSGANVG